MGEMGNGGDREMTRKNVASQLSRYELISPFDTSAWVQVEKEKV
jgi:hypothetical protein